LLTIRRTLIGLFVLLGLALCVSVALQTIAAVAEFRDAEALRRSNQVREALARAAVAVAEERREAYLSLLGGQAGERSHAVLSEETDAVLRESAATLGSVDQEGATAVLAQLEETLGRVRAEVDRGPALDVTESRERAASAALAGYSQVVKELFSLRAALLAREHPADPATAAAFQMRRYTSVLLEHLMLNQALIGGLLANSSPDGAQANWEEIERNGDRAELSYEFLLAQNGTDDRQLRLDLAALEVAYGQRYRPLERSLLSAQEEASTEASSQDVVRSNAYLLLWGARDIQRIGAKLKEALFRYSRERLEEQRDEAQIRALAWGGLFLAGLAAVAAGAWAVLSRVVRPLERVSTRMLALAEGDLETPLPEHKHRDEIGAMSDALRVFRANGVRRQRLQKEREALHERLKEAHEQLRLDLEAASAVQVSLLPDDARLGGVAFSGRLRASSFISGDTYDVLRQPNGPVHFFLADVAGHGAAAALVSVASRSAIAQVVLRRQAGDSLGEAMAAVNDDWPEHLTYFTMILGELRPEDGQGTLVQAGHPPPLLLRGTGGVEFLGEGGLPVGVLRQATYEEVRFDFAPGDRLLVYSDGLTEAEDASGQPFTEERLAELVREHSGLGTEELLARVTDAVQDWGQADTLEDDMTVLVLEAVSHGGVEQVLRA
jgi:serine phosphatase RsbU (regulator of sigma subunit)